MTLASPYTFPFAAAMPPHAQALMPDDTWLTAIAASGYTHLCLQNDPFFHPEMDLRDTGENNFRLLSLFDMTAGPRQRGYLQWLNTIDHRAHAHGLKLAMELWEPRLSRLARRTLPPQWKGPPIANGWIEPLCLSHPDAHAWLMQQFVMLIRTMPHLDALVLGINDNNAFLCHEDCPRCGTMPAVQRLGKAYGDIEKACHAVRPELRVIAYDWMWDEAHYQAVLPQLDAHPSVLTRMERGADYTPDLRHPQWHGVVFDESTGCDALGQPFTRAKQEIQRHQGSLYVMPAFSGQFEAFQLPYIPAVGCMAAKLDRMRSEGARGWVDYDCGGIHEGLMLDLVATAQHHPEDCVEQWLMRLAAKRYGDVEAAQSGQQIWQAFDAAVKVWPAQIDIEGVNHASGQIMAGLGLLPLHPFLPERIIGPDAGRRVYHFDPHNLARQSSMAPMRTLIAQARRHVSGVEVLYEHLLRQVPASRRATITLERDIARMVLLHWQSCAHFFDWAASLLGETSINRIAVLEAEIQTTRQFRALAIRPELGYGNMTWYPDRCVSMSVPQASADLWRAIEVNRCAAWVNQPLADKVGDLWEWKIAHLQQQASA